MGCEVCIGGDGGDYDGMPEFENLREVKARVGHRCGECGAGIEKGAVYQRWSAKFDGDMQTFKTCALCAEVRRIFSCEGQWPAFGDLWNSMGDGAFPSLTTATECFRLCSPAAKERVLGEWRLWKGLEEKD